MSTVRPKDYDIAAGGETDHGLVLEGKRKQIVEDMIALLSSKPTVEIIERSWREDAVFEDPLAIAIGRKEYCAQFWAMPAVLGGSYNEAWKVMVSTTNPNVIEYEQRQRYIVSGIKTEKVIKSVIRIELDENEKIVKVSDQWGGTKLPTGMIASKLRRLNGKMVPKMVTVPKM